MYAAIYSAALVDGKRQHLGNIRDLTVDLTERTFDTSGGTAVGISPITNWNSAVLVVIADESGFQKGSGFIKNIKVEDGVVSFSIDDLKRVLDTEILIDFSQDGETGHTIEDVFAKVRDAILSTKDPFASSFPVSFSIPNDTTDTKAIADYTGKYFISNGMKFLKVYLAYYNYFIKANYNPITDNIEFTFTPQQLSPEQIQLEDFVHEKTSGDIKVNKVIATISYQTELDESEPAWEDSNETYWNAQPTSMRGEIFAESLPPTDGYSEGFALKKTTSLEFQSATQTDYDNADQTSVAWIDGGHTTCPAFPPSFADAVAALGDSSNYQLGTVIEVHFRTDEYVLCIAYKMFVKVTAAVAGTYHKIYGKSYVGRPALPEKIYTLGTDNQIYEEYAPTSLRMYPIIAKIFEAAVLFESQLNAVYELVNGRYIENIIITEDDVKNVIEIKDLELYTMIEVFDVNTDSKLIPISEKQMIHDSDGTRFKIKLGFKKTKLTEIIKNDIGESGIVRSVSKGKTNVYRFEPFESDVEPENPLRDSTWLRPSSMAE